MSLCNRGIWDRLIEAVKIASTIFRGSFDQPIPKESVNMTWPTWSQFRFFSLLTTLVSLLAPGCLRSACCLMIGKYSDVFAVRHVLVNCQDCTCSVKIMTDATTIDFRSFRQWLQTLQAAYYEGTLMDRFSMRASMVRCL